ncbi:MAG TPA: DUF998 domain-containing protein [Candidatus Saccharimonadales bacterium]|nr:DUF998 domain-containing protein [Candidatus Saccharimonadales bacterium]
MNPAVKTIRFTAYAGLFFYSLWIVSYVFNPHLSYTQSYVSELDVGGQPYVWLFRIGNFLGSSLLFTAFYLFLIRTKSRAISNEKILILKILCLGTGAAILNSFFPMDCSASQSKVCFEQQQKYTFGPSQWVHLVTSIIMFGGLIFVQYYSTFNIIKSSASKLWYRISLSSFLLQALLNIVLIVVSFTGYGPIGLLQRLSLLCFELWFIFILFNKRIKLLSE